MACWPTRWLLHFHQTATAAVGDTGFGDLVVGDLVVGVDILRSHDTGDVKDADFLVHPDFLRAADDELPFSRMPVTTAATSRFSFSDARSCPCRPSSRTHR